jgi:hypothetical protein
MNEHMTCPECGKDFNPANLAEVFYHEHKDICLNLPVVGKRVIKHAREVYPGCSAEFASGVHSYLHGEDYPSRPCSDELIQGYYRAESDLQNNYILQP